MSEDTKIMQHPCVLSSLFHTPGGFYAFCCLRFHLFFYVVGQIAEEVHARLLFQFANIHGILSQRVGCMVKVVYCR